MRRSVCCISGRVLVVWGLESYVESEVVWSLRARVGLTWISLVTRSYCPRGSGQDLEFDSFPTTDLRWFGTWQILDNHIATI